MALLTTFPLYVYRHLKTWVLGFQMIFYNDSRNRLPVPTVSWKKIQAYELINNFYLSKLNLILQSYSDDQRIGFLKLPREDRKFAAAIALIGCLCMDCEFINKTRAVLIKCLHSFVETGTKIINTCYLLPSNFKSIKSLHIC